MSPVVQLFWIAGVAMTFTTTFAIKCHSCSTIYHESAVGGLKIHDTCSDKQNWGEVVCEGLTDHCLYYSLNGTVAGCELIHFSFRLF